MISLFSFILVVVGCVNWLTIGLLQFDFVAGLFGSQSNIFSRIIYFLVGVSILIVCFFMIKDKGKFQIKFKKKVKPTLDKSQQPQLEAGKDISEPSHIETSGEYKRNEGTLESNKSKIHEIYQNNLNDKKNDNVNIENEKDK